MTDDGDVDRRLAELEEVLDREAAGAQRAVDAPATDADGESSLSLTKKARPPAARPGPGVTILKLAGLGVAAIVGLKIAVPLLLLPVIGALTLAWTVTKLALLGAAVYGLWALFGREDTKSLEE